MKLDVSYCLSHKGNTVMKWTQCHQINGPIEWWPLGYRAGTGLLPCACGNLLVSICQGERLWVVIASRGSPLGLLTQGNINDTGQFCNGRARLAGAVWGCFPSSFITCGWLDFFCTSVSLWCLFVSRYALDSQSLFDNLYKRKKSLLPLIENQCHLQRTEISIKSKMKG